MTVSQIYALMNQVTGEVLGETAVLNEDLSNTVDIGVAIFNAHAVDNYVRSLVDHIGKVIFVNRAYTGNVPSVLMDGWEYASVLEKINAELPDATENETWELEGGTSYDPNIFYKPKVEAKFFNKRVTFEVPISFTEKQVKESFDSAAQLNGFISMLMTSVENSLTVKIDGLIMQTINNMTAETLYGELNGTYTGKTGVRAVNLLHMYNTKFTKELTADQAVTDGDFLRYASYIMSMYVDRLGKMSTLFNAGKKERFTPKDMLHFVLLSNFAKAADSYLYSGTFHDDMVKLPAAETVPYWQGTGEDYAFESASKIDVKTAGNNTVQLSGILGVMFDRDALGVTNTSRRTTTNYNPKAEFYSNWNKYEAGYFNDFNENFVVFYAA